MTKVFTRRDFTASTGALAAMICTAGACAPLAPRRASANSGKIDSLEARLEAIASRVGGTFGAGVYDPAGDTVAAWNGQKRFPHCSSFKASLAAMVLDLHGRQIIDGNRVLRWEKAELMWVSPFTTSRLNEGATFLELARATQITSDNTAANVLLRELGGPGALTTWWRSNQDTTSRLDRTEPQLNNVPPGEERDTTTPEAMARTLAAVLYGGVLVPAASSQLAGWMVETETGLKRVRAGLPAGWRAGDKTGTAMAKGMGSAYVDIGFVEVPDLGPVTFATYFIAEAVHEDMDPAAQNVLADVGRAIGASFLL